MNDQEWKDDTVNRFLGILELFLSRQPNQNEAKKRLRQNPNLSDYLQLLVDLILEVNHEITKIKSLDSANGIWDYFSQYFNGNNSDNLSKIIGAEMKIDDFNFLSNEITEIIENTDLSSDLGDIYETLLSYEPLVNHDDLILIINLGKTYYFTSKYLQDINTIQRKALHTLLIQSSKKQAEISLPKHLQLIVDEICPTHKHRGLKDVITQLENPPTIKLLNKSNTRKQQGSYFSNHSLVEPLVLKTISPLIIKCELPEDILSIKIIDPAMGSGNFLKAAQILLSKRLEDLLISNKRIGKQNVQIMGKEIQLIDKDIQKLCEKLILEHCMYGIDIDDVAVKIARFILLDDIHEHLICADALTLDWKTKFPDVFNRENPGFDAIIGNPPWEVIKPNSKEFFSFWDPLYRRYSKKEAKKIQEDLFTKDHHIEHLWNGVLEQYKQRSEFLRDSKVSGFYHQGTGDLNNYKLFTELSYNILRDQGRCGLIIPSGISSDAGTKPLRKLLIAKTHWEMLFSFINHKLIFPIHRSYKFSCIIYQKGGKTENIECSFMNEDIQNWIQNRPGIPIGIDVIKTFSPKDQFLPEITTQDELSILNKVYRVGKRIETLISKSELKYVREFDFTNKMRYLISHQNIHIDPKDKNYTDFGIVVTSSKIYLPVIQGANIHIGNFAYQNYQYGGGNQARFTTTAHDRMYFRPQFFMTLEAIQQHRNFDLQSVKIGFRHVTNSTNTRSMISSLVPDFPAINAVPVLYSKGSLTNYLLVAMCTNSLLFDFVLRRQLSGTNLTLHLLSNLPVLDKPPRPWSNAFIIQLSILYLNWTCNAPVFSSFWKIIMDKWEDAIPVKYWAITAHERKRIEVIINCVVLTAFNITPTELEIILPKTTNDPKGLWKIEKGLSDEIRLVSLCKRAYLELYNQPIENYLTWQFPSHVQQTLGPRFADWQEKLTDESAEQLALGYAERLDEIFHQR